MFRCTSCPAAAQCSASREICKLFAPQPISGSSSLNGRSAPPIIFSTIGAHLFSIGFLRMVRILTTPFGISVGRGRHSALPRQESDARARGPSRARKAAPPTRTSPARSGRNSNLQARAATHGRPPERGLPRYRTMRAASEPCSARQHCAHNADTYGHRLAPPGGSGPTSGCTSCIVGWAPPGPAVSPRAVEQVDELACSKVPAAPRMPRHAPARHGKRSNFHAREHVAHDAQALQRLRTLRARPAATGCRPIAAACERPASTHRQDPAPGFLKVGLHPPHPQKAHRQAPPKVTMGTLQAAPPRAAPGVAAPALTCSQSVTMGAAPTEPSATGSQLAARPAAPSAARPLPRYGPAALARPSLGRPRPTTRGRAMDLHGRRRCRPYTRRQHRNCRRGDPRCRFQLGVLGQDPGRGQHSGATDRHPPERHPRPPDPRTPRALAHTVPERLHPSGNAAPVRCAAAVRTPIGVPTMYSPGVADVRRKRLAEGAANAPANGRARHN